MIVKVKFNGVVLNNRFLISDLERPLPEFRDASTDVEGMDGSSFDWMTIGPRECSFYISTCGRTKKQQQTDARYLMSVFAVRKPTALTFSDEKDGDGNQLVRYAVPTGQFSVEEFMVAGRWKCSFRMHDPYLYGKSRSVVLSANSAKTVDTGGNVEAFPTFVANPSGSSYTISRSGGQHVEFVAPFSGQKITVNSKEQKVSVSPSVSNASGITTTSRFFSISGRVTLTASAKTTVSWTERWL